MSLNLEKDSAEIRQKLAQAYQILARLGLDDHTYTHLSARAEDQKSFYIYPFGLRFEEVDASVLIKVSFEGEILVGEEYQYNRTGYVIHGNIYAARPDLQAVFHIHSPAIVAVSCHEQGLLPLSQWALHFYDHIALHNYDSLALENSQGSDIVKDLGTLKTMLLRNHGAITCGETLPEALFYAYHLYQACKTQCLALNQHQPVVMPSAEICRKTVKDLLSFEKNLGERDWQAWMRVLELDE